MTTEHKTWAKLLNSAAFGQVLVTTGWDDDEEQDCVKVETRGRFITTLTLRAPSEEVMTKMFDAITEDNVDEVRKGLVPEALAKLERDHDHTT